MTTATSTNPSFPTTPPTPGDPAARRPSAATAGPANTGGRPRRRRRGIVLALAAGLVVAGLARPWAAHLQAKAYMAGPYADASGGGDAAAAVATTLGNADSYFLVLMLGGLRGPLAMYLWSSSENQKNERDLEDFNTKVNLIRLIQPEFDSVHIFQVWNKAYNASVQIASLPDRYATILDAAEYGKQVARSRPNNVNILLTLNQVFQQKLGLTVGDNVYYRRQVRQDTKWRPPEPPRAGGAMAQRLESMLDPQGKLLPALLGEDPKTGQPMRGIVPAPADLQARAYFPVRRADEFRAAAAAAGVTLPPVTAAPGERETTVALPAAHARALAAAYSPPDVAYVHPDWNDGSEMQYLREYAPFPYGLSPLAIGFSYGKRAQVLINRTKQKPAQYSDSVVDSRPGVELRDWAKEERDRALAAEGRLFGKPSGDRRFKEWLAAAKLVPEGPVELDYSAVAKVYLDDPSAAAPARSRDLRYDDAIVEKFGQQLATARVPGPVPTAGPDLDEALYSYRLAARLVRDARAEFVRHLNHPGEGIRRLSDFSSPIDELSADQLVAEADYAFLLALAPDASREKQRFAAEDWATFKDLVPAGQTVIPRDALLKRAAAKYQESVVWLHYINLRYYFPGEITQLTLPPALPANPVARAAWEAAERVRAAVADVHLARMAEYNNAPGAITFPLPLARPREALDQLRWDPDQLDRIYKVTVAAAQAGPRLDQNKSNRDEGRPAEDRAVYRLAEIQRLLGGAK
jgi:hypothetical protein